MQLAEAKLASEAPQWMSEEAYATLNGGYLLPDETPKGMYTRLARAASNYYSELGDDIADKLFNAFLMCLWEGYLSPSTPVAANFGTVKSDDRGLPVSCFGLKPANSIDGIFQSAHEAAMLSKNGGGLGIDLTSLEGISPVTHWARLYDTTATIVSQGNTRRGAVALYLNADHCDIEEFLDSHDTTRGDQKMKLNCNIALKLSDDFMERVKSGEERATRIFMKALQLRWRTGSPYLQFSDNINNNRPIDYVANELFVSASQLCSEIMLHSSPVHTYSCVLSSLNLSRWDEWRRIRVSIDYRLDMSVPQLGILFLDAVCQEFIDKAAGKPGMANAVRSAVAGRPLGLGVLGLHTLYQKRMFPFGSWQAFQLNKEIFATIREEATKASLWLGETCGIPAWCKASKQRNTHLLAVAPTLSNSVLCNAGSAGIEPIASNYYIYEGPKGSYIRRNEELRKLLAKHDMDTNEVWQSIIDHDGSVMHLQDRIQLADLVVFSTAYEINQQRIIEQAADRQKFLDQGQSLNLFFNHDADPREVAKLHIMAWQKGLFTLYYVRSNSPLSAKRNTTLEANKGLAEMQVVMHGRDGCTYCSKAKRLLKQYGIEYTYILQENGPVPQIYADGNLIGGYTELAKELNVQKPQIACEACDG